MKILHTSDWHIGHALYAKKRMSEHEKFLSWLTEQICEREIDALIVSGDVFDTGTPGGQAQRLYYDFLTSLLGTCCNTVVIVAGNHDSPGLLEAPAGVLERLRIHIIGLPAEPERHVITLYGKDKMPGAICCAVPYLRKNEMVKMDDDSMTSDDKIALATEQFYSEVVGSAVLFKNQFYEDLPLIATGHLFVQGASRREGDGLRDLYVGSLGQVGTDIFPDALRYVALGHIHSEQCVMGKAHIRYCGSPLPMSFSELDQIKYVLEIDTKKDIQKIEVPVFQRLKTICGDYDTIISGLKAIADEDVWIEVTYTGKEVLPELSFDVYEAVRGKKAEVLSIRNAAILSNIVETSDNLDTLETMRVEDVFLRCIENNSFSNQHSQELIDCFNEIVAELEGKDTCA
ncbi:MAG: exonuclease SbcCD subunit D C-terminal domain-containing protein [Christensenellales bacterium]|jgi:exonuclease SbcD